MVKCCAPKCPNVSHKKTPNITFHRFPKNESLRKIWIKNVNKKDWQPNPLTVLCSKHFADHYVNTTVDGAKLSYGAIPTIFASNKPSTPGPGPSTRKRPRYGTKSETYITEAAQQDDSDDSLGPDTTEEIYIDAYDSEPHIIEDLSLQDDLICKICNYDIIGFRYTCLQCVDWDMCAACEARGEHAAHYVLRLPAPTTYVETEPVVTDIRKYLNGRLKGKKDMPFKVVQTVENGKKCLAVISNDWEEQGSLSRRPRSEDSSVQDDNSVSGKNWSTAVDTPITMSTSNNTMVDNTSINEVNTSYLLKNQTKILEILNKVQADQKKILHQHKVQYNEFVNKMADYSLTGAVENPLGERYPPIKTVEELYLLEDNLKNPEFRSKYFKAMSTLCSPGLGAKGTSICYKIVDYFFSRELFTLVSWSGTSRDQNEKVGFKFFSQTRQVFFSVIHNADPNASQLETDNFIRCIIKNSKQRLLAALKPASDTSPKTRKKRPNNDKSQNDATGSNTEPSAEVEDHSTSNVNEQSND